MPKESSFPDTKHSVILLLLLLFSNYTRHPLSLSLSFTHSEFGPVKSWKRPFFISLVFLSLLSKRTKIRERVCAKKDFFLDFDWQTIESRPIQDQTWLNKSIDFNWIRLITHTHTIRKGRNDLKEKAYRILVQNIQNSTVPKQEIKIIHPKLTDFNLTHACSLDFVKDELKTWDHL